MAAANAANSQSDDEDSAEDSDDDGVAPEPRISDPLGCVPIMMILLGNDLPSICRSMNMPHASTRNLSMKVWRGGRGKTQNGAMVH